MTDTPNPVVATRKGYELRANGELWVTGEYGFMAGYVMDPGGLDCAIDAHEEEMRVMMAEAERDFG